MPRSLVAAAALLLFSTPALAAPEAPPTTVEIAVTGEGFVPSRIRARKGQKLRLVVTRKTERTCATEIVIREAGVNQKLPLDKPVVVELTPKQSGKLRFACAMDMIAGEIAVD
ncbi:MAG: cupredoxin domain-containing protein [Deltaproteobacteria bacterium]|nr:cupredoxin domain-containing protein [Deltaproteobacteria bacterium]